MINKQQQRVFVNDVCSYIMSFGAKELTPFINDGTRQFRLEGNINAITYTIRPVGEHKHCYSIFARYDKLNDLTGPNNTKYNWLSSSWDFDSYIDESISRISNHKKQYEITYNVGRVKYLVSFYSGVKQHKDGSKFWEIHPTNNKKELNSFVKQLEKEGYKYKSALN